MGLQKFTDSRLAETIPEELEFCLKRLVSGTKLDLADVWKLNETERETIKAVFTAGVLTLAGEDREQFLSNTEEILSETTRSEIWERNHNTIMWAVDFLTRSTGSIPTLTRIAAETQLSRVTVSKHLKEYYNSQTYKDKEGALKCLKEGLLMRMYAQACNGNMKAAKLFLDSCSSPQHQNATTVQNQQNNYVQINGLVIGEKEIGQLPQDKRIQLKEILAMIDTK